MTMKRNKEDMEGRYINLSMDSVTATFNSNTSHNTEYCVKMSGVPFRSTEQELRDFFRGAADPVRVKVILNRDGRPSGDALAEFDSEIRTAQLAIALEFSVFLGKGTSTRRVRQGPRSTGGTQVSDSIGVTHSVDDPR